MRGKRWTILSAALLAAGLAMACEESGEAGGEGDVPQPYLAQPLGPGGPTGVVLETMGVPRYTYARVEVAGAQIWTAAPGGAPSVGDTIYLGGADNMGE